MAFKGTLQRLDGKGAKSTLLSVCDEGYELRSRLPLELWCCVSLAPGLHLQGGVGHVRIEPQVENLHILYFPIKTAVWKMVSKKQV